MRVLSQEKVALQVAEILKAIAHPLRLRIVAILDGGEETVSGLVDKLSEKQSFVSQQLRILRMAGLVTVLREDGYAKYSLANPKLRELVSCVEHCFLEHGK